MGIGSAIKRLISPRGEMRKLERRARTDVFEKGQAEERTARATKTAEDERLKRLRLLQTGGTEEQLLTQATGRKRFLGE